VRGALRSCLTAMQLPGFGMRHEVLDVTGVSHAGDFILLGLGVTANQAYVPGLFVV